MAELAPDLVERAERELEALVGVSSPSGDVPAAEEAIALCSAFLPPAFALERVPCSSPANAPDLVARLPGTGRRRLLLLGHLDTVIGHSAHTPMRRSGDRLYGPGTVDMKGGVVLAIELARLLAEQPGRFAELSVLLVTDEEWRTEEFAHVDAFAGYDACLCFEAGETTAGGDDAVVVRRKAAGTVRITAAGRASHSGSAPDHGRSALLALSATALELAARHDPHGPDRLSVVPTILSSGEALNVVPDAGELILDMRADRLEAFDPVLDLVPIERNDVQLDPVVLRRWPGMDSRAQVEVVLAAAGRRLGRPIIASGRGGASDASHFAAGIPLTIDGLGPRGGGAHTNEEFILRDSLRTRAEVALAVAETVLEAGA